MRAKRSEMKMKLPLTSERQNRKTKKKRQRNMSPLLFCSNLCLSSRQREVLSSFSSSPSSSSSQSLSLSLSSSLPSSSSSAFRLQGSLQRLARKMIANKNRKRKKQTNKKLSLKQEGHREEERTSSTIMLASKQIMLLMLLTMCVIIIPEPSNQVPKQLHGKQAPLSLLPAHLNVNHLNQITPQPLFLSPVNNQHPDAPKLIPLSALDRYQEGAELKLFCSASAPPSGGRLQLEWRKNNAQQLAPVEVNGSGSGGNSHGASSRGGTSRNLHISMMDDSSSVLRISNLEAEDSGNYTCLARNQFGFDSSTVRVNVNVRLKWIKEPPAELQVRAGKSVQLECDASGQPTPLISWTSLKDQQTINSKVLRVDRVQVNDSGLYECKASNQKHSINGNGNFEVGVSQISDQVLRKVVRLIVNGKYLI